MDYGSFIENFDDMIMASSPTTVESSFNLNVEYPIGLTVKSPIDLAVESPTDHTEESPFDLTPTDDKCTVGFESTHMDDITETFIDKDITVVIDTFLNGLPDNLQKNVRCINL